MTTAHPFIAARATASPPQLAAGAAPPPRRWPPGRAGHRARAGRRRRSASATGRSPPACRSIAAIEKGYFKEAGLDVEPLKFAGAQQVMEAMLSGRCRRQLQRHRLGQPRDRRDRAARHSSRSSAPTRATRRTCSTSSSCPRTARSRRMADLKGKRVASGPGIQNVTLAKTVLERARRHRRHRDRAADRPARGRARRGPGRRRATRWSRPAPSAA